MVSFIRLQDKIKPFNFSGHDIKINLGLHSQIRHDSLLTLLAKDLQ